MLSAGWLHLGFTGHLCESRVAAHQGERLCCREEKKRGGMEIRVSQIFHSASYSGDVIFYFHFAFYPSMEAYEQKTISQTQQLKL